MAYLVCFIFIILRCLVSLSTLSFFKVPLGRKFAFPIFLYFRVEDDLLTRVTKFQSFTAIGSIFFLFELLFRDFTAAITRPCSGS